MHIQKSIKTYHLITELCYNFKWDINISLMEVKYKELVAHVSFTPQLPNNFLQLLLINICIENSL